MAEICRSSSEVSSSCETNSRAARRRRMEIRRIKVVAGASAGDPEPMENGVKRRRVELICPVSFPRECIDDADENSDCQQQLGSQPPNGESKMISKEINAILLAPNSRSLTATSAVDFVSEIVKPKFGMASVCGRRRDMEDAVAIHPSFCHENLADQLHYFGVYDGHGCSHVATKCSERLHELVKEELLVGEKGGKSGWKNVMERSFIRMDKEVVAWNQNVVNVTANCRCELQTPECDAVGSTAIVAVVTPDKIIVANCGDSRAVLCRNGNAVPLSNDHKPDRPDELNRIQAAGGRVIYWDGPRVLGVLAMSRAIGDNYLKPYVSCEPEVTITDRTKDDDFLILASDGLWDVVSNETACGVAKMCLKGRGQSSSEPSSPENNGGDNGNSDKACSDASMLLTKLALARRSADNVSVVVINLRKES